VLADGHAVFRDCCNFHGELLISVFDFRGYGHCILLTAATAFGVGGEVHARFLADDFIHSQEHPL
jgi:hypothetical protein